MSEINMNDWFKKAAQRGVNPFSMITHIDNKKLSDNHGEGFKPSKRKLLNPSQKGGYNEKSKRYE